MELEVTGLLTEFYPSSNWVPFNSDEYGGILFSSIDELSAAGSGGGGGVLEFVSYPQGMKLYVRK
jgi:hypothetical protein